MFQIKYYCPLTMTTHLRRTRRIEEYLNLFGIDVFRGITTHLNILEFVKLSWTCKTLRLLCMKDLGVGSDEATILDFGMKFLTLATCFECNLTSWNMYYGRCRCQDYSSCYDCLRLERKDLFVLNKRSEYQSKFVPVCRYGCNFVCCVCEVTFANSILVGTVEDWIICNFCYNKHFETSYDNHTGFITSEFIFYPICNWIMSRGKSVPMTRMDYESHHILKDDLCSGIHLCSSCEEYEAEYDIDLPKYNRQYSDSYCRGCIQLNDPNHSKWIRRTFSSNISRDLKSKIEKLRTLVGSKSINWEYPNSV